MSAGGEHPRCPTCGHEFKALPRIDAMIAALGLSGIKKRIFIILASGRGRYLTPREIASVLYDEDSEGGPLSAEALVRQEIFYLRALIAAYGIQIDALKISGGGFRLWAIAHPPTNNGGYQLVETRAA